MPVAELNPKTGYTNYRRRVFLAALLFSFATAVLGILAGVYIERSEDAILTRRMVEHLYLGMELPPDSPELPVKMKLLTGCDVEILQDGFLVNSSFTQPEADEISSLPPARIFPIGENLDIRLYTPAEHKSVFSVLALGGAVAALLAALAAAWIMFVLNIMHRQLRQSRERLALAEKLATADKISSSVVHELRNPLSGIRMNLNVLQEELRETGSPGDTATMLCRELDRIDMYLTSLAGGNLQKSELPSVPFREAEAVAEALAAKATHRRHRIIITFPEQLKSAQVKCNPMNLRRIFYNLATNGLDAMTSAGTLEISATSINTMMKITVTDDGPGINTDAGDIFEPFTTEKKDGCGLGLYICRKLVHQSGGSISWNNVTGHGAGFTVTLPFFPQNAGEQVVL